MLKLYHVQETVRGFLANKAVAGEEGGQQIHVICTEVGCRCGEMEGQVAEADVSDQQEMANTRGKLSKFATLAALKTLDDKDMPALVERGTEQKVTWP